MLIIAQVSIGIVMMIMWIIVVAYHIGAWLLRRQGNIKNQIGERLCEIIARNVITNESLGEDEDAKAYNQGLETAMETIKEYCEVDKE